MNLHLVGHDDRYCVEQLQMTLFGDGAEGKAKSSLFRGKTWLTAVTCIMVGEKSARGVRRMKLDAETVPLRRQLLQQSYYLAAIKLLETVPAWGALAGVRPTKLSTRHLLQGAHRWETSPRCSDSPLQQTPNQS